MKSLISTTLLALLLAAPQSLAAQQSPAPDRPPEKRWKTIEELEAEMTEDQPSPDPRLELTALGGALVSEGHLTRREFAFNTELADGGAYGADLAFWWPVGQGAVGGGVEVWHGPGIDINTSPGENGFPLPGGIGQADYTSAMFLARYRYWGETGQSIVQPYWALGMGVRHIEVQPIAPPDLTSATNLAGAGELGAYLRLGSRVSIKMGLGLNRGGYDDGISDQPQTQSEMTFLIGTTFRLY